MAWYCPACREWHRGRHCPSCKGLGARLPLRQRVYLLRRLRRIERRLDSEEVRGTGLNMRWYGWMSRYMEVFDLLGGEGPRR
jgi:hypothetical protein